MVPNELGPIEMGILHALQRNARNRTTVTIGERVGISSSTVSNRINDLEERGVVTGYHPSINYEKAGLSHHVLVVGAVPFAGRNGVADDIMRVDGAVSVVELLTNHENLAIELVGHARTDIEGSLVELDALGVDIERTEMVKRRRTRPYNHFGKQFAGEERTE